MESGRSQTDRPSKSLSVYAEELRQWLALTRQCQIANQMQQVALLNSCLTSNSSPSEINNSSGIATHASGSSNGSRVPGRQELPRTFPVSAG